MAADLVRDDKDNPTRLRRVGGWALDHAASGLIGTLALVVAIALWKWGYPRTRSGAEWIDWPSFVGFGVVTVGFILGLLYWARETRSLGFDYRDLREHFDQVAQRVADTQVMVENRLRISERFIELDDSVLRLLAGVLVAPHLEQAVQNLYKELMRDAMKLMGQGASRSSLLLPEGDYLRPWILDQVPKDPAREFYIGPNGLINRGVAGMAFVLREAQIVHIDTVDGAQTADHPSYIVFDGNRAHIPYCSFIAQPAVNDDGECVAVVCFDSPDRDIFDNPGYREYLAGLGRRIASVRTILDRWPGEA